MLTPMVGAVALIIFLHEASRESGLLDRAVRHELDPETVGRGFDVFWHLVSTVGPQEGRVGAVPVPDLQEVVHTVVVVLNLE